MKYLIALGMALFIVSVTLYVGITTFQGCRIVKMERPFLALLTFVLLLVLAVREK